MNAAAPLDALFPAAVRAGELSLAPYRKVSWSARGVVTSLDYFDAASLAPALVSKASPKRRARTWLDRLVGRSVETELCVELRSHAGWRLLLRAAVPEGVDLSALPERRHLGTRVPYAPLSELLSTLRALDVAVELAEPDEPEAEGPTESSAEPGAEAPLEGEGAASPRDADLPIDGAITLSLEGQERPARLVRVVDSLGALPEVAHLINGLRPIPGAEDEVLRADLRSVLEPGEEVEAVWLVVSLRRKDELDS